MNNFNLDDLKDAYSEEFKFHDENIIMLSWYCRLIAREIGMRKPESILSLGIGHKIVSSSLIGMAETYKNYTIIEGSQEMIKSLKETVCMPPNVSLVHSLFEDYNPNTLFDMIEAGFILEHVDDPLAVIRHYSRLLTPEGCMLVAVPNAQSLHRRLGHAAGQLKDIYSLSPHDLALGHKRYFDIVSLRNIIEQAGLQISACEGIYLKPFSLTQMQSLNLSPDIVRALYTLGASYPELCNALFCEVTIRH